MKKISNEEARELEDSGLMTINKMLEALRAYRQRYTTGKHLVTDTARHPISRIAKGKFASPWNGDKLNAVILVPGDEWIKPDKLIELLEEFREKHGGNGYAVDVNLNPIIGLSHMKYLRVGGGFDDFVVLD